MFTIKRIPTIENSTYACGICTLEEYKKSLSYKNEEPILIISDEVIAIELQLEFPFTIPATSMLRARVLTDALRNHYDVYFGNLPDNKKIRVSIPKPMEYPAWYWWNFHLIVPEKLAMCVWGLEEGMAFMDENFARSWKVEFLEYYKYRDGGSDDTGGSIFSAFI